MTNPSACHESSLTCQLQDPIIKKEIHFKPYKRCNGNAYKNNIGHIDTDNCGIVNDDDNNIDFSGDSLI